MECNPIMTQEQYDPDGDGVVAAAEYLEIPFSASGSHTIYVEKRTDSYTEDGTQTKPFKTVAAAISLRLTKPSDEYWCIRIGAGVYTEDNSGGALTLPTLTQFTGDGPFAVCIKPSDPDNDLFATPTGMGAVSVGGMMGIFLDGDSSNETAIKADPGNPTTYQFWQLVNMQISNFDKGIKVEEPLASVMANTVSFSGVKKAIHVDEARFHGNGLRISHQASGGDYGVKAEDNSTVRIWNCTLDGTFDEGLYADHSEIHMWGLRIDDPDVGIRTKDGGEVKCWSVKVNDPGTWSILMEDATDQVILTGAEIEVSKISQAAGSKLVIAGRYMDRFQCGCLANHLVAAFLGDDETYIRLDDASNALVDFFADSSKIESSADISVVGGEVTLDANTTDTQYDALDAVATPPWYEVWYSGDGAFALDTSVYNEGTGSLKMTHTSTGTEQLWYGIRKNIGSYQDWSSYGAVKIDIKTSIPNVQVQFGLYSSGSPIQYFYYTTSSTNWETAIFDISSASRGSVYYCYFRLTRKSTSYTCNLDNWRRVSNPIYDTSGSLTSYAQVIQNGLDVYEILPYVNGFEAPFTSLSMDISLDGGNHWKTGLGIPRAVDWWQTTAGGVLETADASEAWDNKKNLKVRFNLTTTDTEHTPTLDDYFVIWRVDEA